MEGSLRDLVLLWLEHHEVPAGGPAPPAVTVPGIASALELEGSVAGQVDLLSALSALRESGLVERSVRPAEGGDGPRWAYALTDRGREAAGRRREALRGTRVVVTNGGTEEVPLSEADRFFEDAPLVRALARATPDGTVPLDRYAGEGFVGRTDELAALEAAFEAACEREARTVLVTGEAGVGKTALVEEALDRLDDHPENPSVARGGHEAGGTAPYRGIRTALSDLPEAPPLSDLLEDPGEVPDGDPDLIRARRRANFRAVADALRSAAADRPVVLVLEDLQWADRATLSLFSYLVDEVTGWLHPVLFVATARSGALEGGALADLAGTVAGTDRHLRVDLDPLSPLDTRGVLQAALGTESLPDDLVEAVHERTGGNPLFVEETATHLVETGAADPASGEFAGAGAVPVPDRVTDAVAGRLADLDAPSRELLELAAVLGERVGEGTLAAAADLDGPDLRERDYHLVGGRLLERTDDGVAFVHDLVREAALEGIDPDDRPAYHRRAAEAVAAVGPGDPVDQHARVARHREAAGRDRPAVEAYRRAGDAAADVYAHGAAVEHYRTALGIARDRLDDPDLAAETAADLAAVHLTVGEYDDAEARVEEARRLADGDGLARRLAGLAGRVENARGDHEAAIERVDSALPGDGSAPEDRRTAELLDVRARALRELARFDDCLETARRQLSVAEATGDDDLLADAHHHLGEAHTGLSESGRATEQFRRAIEVRGTENRWAEGRTREALAMAAMNEDRYGEAIEEYEAALSAYEAVGARHAAAGVHEGIGEAHWGSGEYGAARERFETALAAYRELGDRHGAAGARLRIGAAEQALGEEREAGEEHFDRAREQYERVLSTLREVGDRQGELIVLLNLGDLATRAGEFEPARDRLERALDIAEEVGNAYHVVEIRKSLGRLFAERGDRERAREHLQRALSVDGEEGSPTERLDVLQRLVDLDGADPVAVRRWCERALDLVDGYEGTADLSGRREWFRSRLAELDEDPDGEAAD